jgi:hypothetical protein
MLRDLIFVDVIFADEILDVVEQHNILAARAEFVLVVIRKTPSAMGTYPVIFKKSGCMVLIHEISPLVDWYCI